MMIAPPIKGTLPAAGTVALSLGNGQPPFTVQLNSVSAGRAISISADGGITFAATVPTVTVASTIIYMVNSPLSQVLLAGSAGDSYEIL